MTIRKRRQPTPDYKLPPPYQPLTGEQASLQMQGVFPYVAMMQVAAEDTIQDYVLCRGFDVRIARFIDYAVGDASKPGIPVAKPFGSRGAGKYTIGQIFPAILPLQTDNSSPVSVPWRVGQNPGVSETTVGHPADLSETVGFLKDANDVFINWMLLDGGSSETELIECCLAENHPGYGVVFTVKLMVWDSTNNGHKPDSDTDDHYAIDWRYGMPSYPLAGARGLFIKRQGTCNGAAVDMYEVVSLDCEKPPIACTEAEEATCTSY